MVSCRRFACLLSVFLFIAMRVLSHAHPVPLPWTSGVFDADGLDDILQTIRIPYVRSGDVRHVAPKLLAIATGSVAAWEPSVVGGVFLTSPQSRAPPRS